MKEDNNTKWQYGNHSISPCRQPHVRISESEMDDINTGSVWNYFPQAIRLTYITDWDCQTPTNFWYVIKDTPFDISKLKAKRRYEITKGDRNFLVKLIQPVEECAAMYEVYKESLEGYKNHPAAKSYTSFQEEVNGMQYYEKNIGGVRVMLVYAAYNEDGRMCGYAHLIKYRDCCLFSLLKTIPSAESKGINAAICHKILIDLEQELSHGDFYLSDGARNLYHETHFQDYLEKYFGFRKAYCRLNIVYRPWVKLIMILLYPFRKIVKLTRSRALSSLLMSEMISRECKKK